jgi:hypothetical protein
MVAFTTAGPARLTKTSSVRGKTSPVKTSPAKKL